MPKALGQMEIRTLTTNELHAVQLLGKTTTVGLDKRLACKLGQ